MTCHHRNSTEQRCSNFARAVAAYAVLAVAAETALARESPPASAAPQYTGERLSLNFQNVEVRGVLQLIADFAGLNLVAGDDIAGNITLRLADVPWDEALDLVLAINGLDKRQTGNILLVGPAAKIAAREKLELESRRALTELAPLETEFLRIRYAKATTLAALLGSDEGAALALTDRGRVLVDERTNSLILTDTAGNLDALKRMLAHLDIPIRQVRIEARIVNANSNFSEQLGIRWGGGGYRTRGDAAHLKLGGSLQTLSEVQNILAGTGETEADSGAISHPQDLVADLGVIGEGATSIGLGLTGPGYLLDLELSALAAAGHAEIVARPKVITADKHVATIESGVEIPYQQATPLGRHLHRLQGCRAATPSDAADHAGRAHRHGPGSQAGHRGTHLSRRAERQYHAHRHASAGGQRRNRSARRHLPDRQAPCHHPHPRCLATCPWSGGYSGAPWNGTTNRSCLSS